MLLRRLPPFRGQGVRRIVNNIIIKGFRFFLNIEICWKQPHPNPKPLEGAQRTCIFIQRNKSVKHQENSILRMLLRRLPPFRGQGVRRRVNNIIIKGFRFFLTIEICWKQPHSHPEPLEGAQRTVLFFFKPLTF